MHILLACLQRGLLLAFLALGVPAAGAEPVLPGEIPTALRQAQAGEVILIAPGDHGRLSLTGVFGAPGRPVILRSADPQKPAIFTGLSLDGAEHLVFEDIVFDYRFEPGQKPGKFRPFQVQDSKEIGFYRVLFDGDRVLEGARSPEGFGAGFGLSLRGTTNVVIENATFRTFYRGLVVGQSRNVTLRNSDFHAMRSDGANFSAVTSVLIEGNHFHDFEHGAGSGAHPDMIQFWTASTKSPTRDVVIRDNILNAGLGSWTQSIFMRNELVDRKLAGREMFYQQIDISGNVIINAHLHGITLGQTDGLVIRGNTLIRSTIAQGLTQQKEGLATPQIRVSPASQDVTIEGNLVARISGPDKRPDWQVADNPAITLGQRGSALSYDQVFLSARQAGTGDLGHYGYRPESLPEKTGFGSPLLRLGRIETALKGKGAPLSLLAAMQAPLGQSTPSEARALIQVDASRDAINRFRFSPAGAQGDAAAQTRWRLEDGQEITGPSLEVTFPEPGPFRVTMITPAGQAMVEVQVPDPLVFDLERMPREGLSLIPQPDGGRALPMGQDLGSRGLSVGAVGGVFGTQNIAINLRLRTATNHRTPGGEVFRIHEHVIMGITATGAAYAWLNPEGSDKPVSVQSPPLRLNDGNWHQIDLQYSAGSGAGSGEVLLLVDGQLVGRKAAQGPLRAAGGHGLSFGNPFGKKNFEGWLSELTITALAGPWIDTGGPAQLRVLP